MDEPTGSIIWSDLTVENAAAVKDFYTAVIGWKAQPVDMGGYNDYNMNRPTDGETVAGICHNRGPIAALPPQWLMYVTVADLQASLTACQAQGGKVLAGPLDMGEEGVFAVIQDPAGAALAVMQRPIL